MRRSSLIDTGSVAGAARLLRVATAAVMTSCVLLAVGGWVVLSQLNQQWQELVDSTDDGLQRVEGVLSATAGLADETAGGLESVDAAVESGGELTDQTSEVVRSVQDVLLPLIKNVDGFAASLEDLAQLIEQNDALALFGLQPSLNSEELAALRRDLADLEEELTRLDLEGGLAADVQGVSTSLDAVVVELRVTEAELVRSAARVSETRDELDTTRNSMTSVIWWSRGLLLTFLLTLALSHLALYALAGALRHGHAGHGPTALRQLPPGRSAEPTRELPVQPAGD